MVRSGRSAGAKPSGSSAKPMWSPGKITGSIPRASGQRRRRTVADLTGRLLADADHDPGRAGTQGLEVGHELDARAHLVAEEEVLVVGGVPVERRPEHLGEHRLGQLDVGVGQEQPPRRRPALGQVRGDDRLGHRPAVLAVLEQLVERRLVGDHRVHQVGSRLGQGQHGDRTAAGPEGRRGTEVEVGQQPGDVVRPHRRRGVLVTVVDRAAVDGARVHRHHGVVAGQQVGERGEGVGVHRRPEQQHGRPGAADLVVEPGAGDVEVPGGPADLGSLVHWIDVLR